MPDLGKFRDARVLRWNRWTVFSPGHGIDGTLYADDDPDGLPLDTYIPAVLPNLAWTRTWVPRLITLPTGVRVLPDGWSETVIGVVADPADLGGLHETLRAWCRDVLGRDDIQFTVRAQDGTFETVDPTACEDS